MKQRDLTVEEYVKRGLLVMARIPKRILTKPPTSAFEQSPHQGFLCKLKKEGISPLCPLPRSPLSEVAKGIRKIVVDHWLALCYRNRVEDGGKQKTEER